MTQEPDRIHLRHDPSSDQALKGLSHARRHVHLMFKLGMCAEGNWRKLRDFGYLAKVITGVKFRDGIEVAQTNQEAV